MQCIIVARVRVGVDSFREQTNRRAARHAARVTDEGVEMPAKQLPQPEDAHELIIERLTIERDAAQAEADAAIAELRRVLASAQSHAITIRGGLGVLTARRPASLSIVEPGASEPRGSAKDE